MASAWLLQTVFLLLNAAYAHAFAFSSPEGITLVRKILLAALPTFEPHTYQMDGICKVLDKVDLVAVNPTGSGKTGFLFLTIIVMNAIAVIPSLCPTIDGGAGSVSMVWCEWDNPLGQPIGTRLRRHPSSSGQEQRDLARRQTRCDE
ncbi:hypothetical protein C8R44DRAFT_878754 [Mycena epipterygia]|nr:hypothetical protein C8R44DRAFT_878754 [Mycena epipterygia]